MAITTSKASFAPFTHGSDCKPGAEFHLTLKEMYDTVPSKYRIQCERTVLELDSDSVRHCQLQWSKLQERMMRWPAEENYHVNGGWGRMAEDFIALAKLMTKEEKEKVISGGPFWLEFSGYAKEAWINYLISTIRLNGIYQPSKSIDAPFPAVACWLITGFAPYATTSHLGSAFSYLKGCSISVLSDEEGGDKVYEVSRDGYSIVLVSEYSYPTFVRALASSIATMWSGIEGTAVSYDRYNSEVRLPQPSLPTPSSESVLSKIASSLEENSAVYFLPTTSFYKVQECVDDEIPSDCPTPYSMKPLRDYGLIVRNDPDGRDLYFSEHGDLKVASIYTKGAVVDPNIFQRCGSSLLVMRAALQYSKLPTPFSDNYLSREDCAQLIADSINLEQDVWIVDVEEDKDHRVREWSALHATSDAVVSGCDKESLLAYVSRHPRRLWLVKGIFREWSLIKEVTDLSLSFEGDEAFGMLDVSKLLDPIWSKENQRPHKAYYGVLQIKLCLLWLLEGCVVAHWSPGTYVKPLVPLLPRVRIRSFILRLDLDSKHPECRGGVFIPRKFPVSPFFFRLRVGQPLRHYFAQESLTLMSETTAIPGPVTVYQPTCMTLAYSHKVTDSAREMRVIKMIRSAGNEGSNMISTWFTPFFSLIPVVYVDESNYHTSKYQVGLYSDTVRIMSRRFWSVEECVADLLPFLSEHKGF